MSYVSHIECSACAERYDPGQVLNVCRCGGPLLVRYRMPALRESWNRDDIGLGPHSMWRYAPALPVRRQDTVVSLGEGMTPLLRSRQLASSLGLRELWIKDEGLNPTGSFKARGLSCAISMAVELGITRVAMPSAGNAAGALAAYAAAAGIKAHIFMPADVPQSNYIECMAYGAEVTLVNGLISDCARMLAAKREAAGWFDLGTLKEPYRIEGKKTMGYELAEQMSWQLPDAILYPTGGGVGLIGMWKAFDEMEQLGWIGPRRPKMIAVQAEGCRPVVQAFDEGADRCRAWERAQTIASGLRVPKPFGDALILHALRRSGGAAAAVSDRELIDAGLELARMDGLFVAPEGAACVAALSKLVSGGVLKPDEKIVIYNTGTGLKYLEAYSVRFPRTAASEQDKLGGLITPR
jgi:threonine synthase